MKVLCVFSCLSISWLNLEVGLTYQPNYVFNYTYQTRRRNTGLWPCTF